MNWSDLQVLLTFKREGTLQKAAEWLAMDISTVSRRIRSLESDLGSKLVENVSGRLVLTSHGERAVQAAAVMEIESDQLQRHVKGQENALSGVLRVALLDLFVLFHADLLNNFKLQHPRVMLELASTTIRTHSLTRREADVAIRVTQQPDETLVGIHVLHIKYAVYAHRSIVDAGTDTESARWDTLPWIGWDSAAHAHVTEAWMANHVPTKQICFRVDSPAAQFILAEAGGGACILPMAYADLSTSLVRLSEALKGFDTDVWLLTHRDLRYNARVQAFLDHVYKGLEPLRDAG